jgi:Arc/MetJ-type ribon-helix-helix transcriptional regulator
MTIHLSGRREQLVLSLLRAGRFASADEVIDEALRLVEQHYEAGGGAAQTDRTSVQLANLKRLGEKLDAIPAAPVVDGLSNRDHDRILYSK